MKNNIRHLFADRIILWSTVISIFFLLVTIIFPVIFLSHLPPFLPLYNRLPWGYSRLGYTWEIFIPIIITLTFLVINLFISSKVYNTAPLVARLINTITILVTLCTCIFTLKIISIVI